MIVSAHQVPCTCAGWKVVDSSQPEVVDQLAPYLDLAVEEFIAGNGTVACPDTYQASVTSGCVYVSAGAAGACTWPCTTASTVQSAAALRLRAQAAMLSALSHKARHPSPVLAPSAGLCPGVPLPACHT